MEEKTILLVEDDFLNRRVSKKILSENGYRVLEAKNAKEAIEILKKESVTLIILDINLGEDEQDGISLGNYIKSKFAVPFIYLTAYENPEIISKAVSTSPYSYLTKPYKNVDLLTSVEIAVKQSEHHVKYKPHIMAKDGDFNIELPLDQISYIESNGNYLLFHTGHKIYKTRSTIKQVIEELPKNIFIQVHRAFIVNKNKIDKFNIKSIVVKDTIIPVSRNYLETISNILRK
jgi:DNA-binding LytR/AlgR family response regulator